MRASKISVVYVLGACLLAAPALGQIATDGSLGARTTLSGPSYFVGATLGQQRGANLFHSFSTFNIGNGESALFETSAGVSNVIARVTGSGASGINGTLSANANLFLVNPNGIQFGPNAALNVSGSFHASTADYLKMSDGARFYANLSSGSTLTVSAPSAFGFLDNAVAPIVSQNNLLAVPAGNSLSLIGGHTTLANSKLRVSRGRLNIAAVTSPGEVAFDSNGLTLSGFGTLGDVRMNQVLVNVDNEETANVFVRAGHFVMENSSALFGVTTSAGASRTIDIDVDSLELKHSGIVTAATGNGSGTTTSIHAHQFDVSDGSAILITAAGVNPGGDISIRADDFRLTGGLSLVGTGAALGSGRAGNVSIQANTINVADGAISAVTGTSGSAGNIDLSSDTLSLSRGAVVTSASNAAGNGGRINVRARDVLIDGSSGALPTGISAITTGGNIGGDAGAITLDVGTLTLKHGYVSTSTAGVGRGGDITVNAQNIAMQNGGSITSETGVVSGALAGNYGRGGAIAITTKAMTMNSGSVVSASTYATGAGGSIGLVTDTLVIDANNETSTTGILANSGAASVSSASGTGGSLNLKVGDLTLRNQGVISASTYGTGTAGRIDLSGGRLSLSSAGIIGASSFGLSANAGAANDIVISATQLDVSDRAQITNNTLGAGRAGRLLIIAPTLTLTSGGSLQASSLSSAANAGAAGDIFINSDTVLVDNAAINARSFGAAGPGGIAVNARQVTLDHGAVFSATSVGSGNAGNISVGATRSLGLFNGSRIVTEALNGSGGNIELFANDRIVFRNSLVSTSVLGANSNGGNIGIDPLFVIVDNSQVIARAVGGSGGNINISTQYLFKSANSAVDASSKVGISGRVEVVGSDVDLNADIAALPTDFLNARKWMSTACASRLGGDVSQFTVNGRDGAYSSPFDLSPSPLQFEAAQPSNNRAANSSSFNSASLPPLSFVPQCLLGPG